MELNIQLEMPSKIVRKLIVTVPAKTVGTRIQRGLVEAQKTAKIKGFRPGHVPLPIIQQQFGADIRHSVFHDLIDESYRQAVVDQKLMPVGRPRIETPNHKTGEGAHDHSLNEGQDLTYTATIEVMPEIEAKDYTGLTLTRTDATVTEEDVDAVIKNMLDSQAQLDPVAGGLALADGTQSSRPVQMGDFVDMTFNGGVVTETGIEPMEGMKGTRMVEVGAGSLIPGFEENLVGMRRGETKTFRVTFPKDYSEASLSEKEAEFTATINEVKEKKLPELTDEFAKQMGAENVEDLRKRARQHLETNQTKESDREMRGALFTQLIEKNPFDLPESMILAQTRILMEEMAQYLKGHGFNDKQVQDVMPGELEAMKKRAESQVRATLLVESIAKQEGISVAKEDIEKQFGELAKGANMTEEQVRDFYMQKPERLENLEFQLREEKTVKHLFEKSKIKTAKKKKD